MISNERRWPSRLPPQRQPYYDQRQPMPPRPPVHEDTIETRDIQIERKHFRLTVKENPRGRFMRISEENNGKFNSIMIPASGFNEFAKMFGELVAASSEIPAKSV